MEGHQQDHRAHLLSEHEAARETHMAELEELQMKAERALEAQEQAMQDKEAYYEKEIARLRNETVEIEAMKKTAEESRETAKKAEAEQVSFRALTEEKLASMELEHSQVLDKRKEEHELTLVRHAREIDAMHLEQEKIQIAREQERQLLATEHAEAVGSLESKMEVALEVPEKTHGERLVAEKSTHSIRVGELDAAHEETKETLAAELERTKEQTELALITQEKQMEHDRQVREGLNRD